MGFIFVFNNGLVNWCLKRQLIVALLSIKKEYIALMLVGKKAIWLWLLFTKLGLFQLNDQHAKIHIGKEDSNAIILLWDNLV